MEAQQRESKTYKKSLIIFSAVLLLIIIPLSIVEYFIPIVRYSIYNRNSKIIACVGDSITHGYGIPLQKYYSYPGQLQLSCKTIFAVKNFGVDGAAAQSSANIPFIQSQEYGESIKCNPQIVLIMLGTNDSKAYNFVSKESFKLEYIELVKSYQDNTSAEQILLLLPINANENLIDINNDLLQSEIRNAILEVAVEMNLQTIDVRASIDKHSYYSDDGVHLNASGAKQIAKAVYQYINHLSFSGFAKLNN